LGNFFLTFFCENAERSVVFGEFIIIWLSLLVLFVWIPFTAKPAGLDTPKFSQADPKLFVKSRLPKKIGKKTFEIFYFEIFNFEIFHENAPRSGALGEY
jgi:hypothetical protein